MGTLRGTQPCHIGTLTLLCAVMNFLAEFLEWHLPFLAPKSTPRRIGEILGGKFVENILFSVRFSWEAADPGNCLKTESS